MTNPARRIRRVLDELDAGGNVHRAIITDVFRLLRLLLEADGLEDAYPYTSLYTTWSVHASLNRHPTLWSIADALDSVWFGEQGNDESPGKQLAKTLGFQELRSELKMLFQANRISTNLLDSRANWHAVLEILILELADRPASLTLPKKPSGAIQRAYERMNARRALHPSENDRRVARIEINHRSPPDAHEGAGFYITFELGPRPHNFRIIGRLLNPEARDAFERD